jgi:hypothetical protein
MFNKAGLAIAALLLLASTAVGQAANRFDVALGYEAVFPKQTSANGIVLSPTYSGGFLGTFRWRFAERHSIETSYGRTNDSQIYTNLNTFRIQSNVTEWTGAYVFSPMETKKYEPFVFGGAGILAFNPYSSFVNTVQVPVPATRQTEFAILYGVGVDCKVFSSVPGLRKAAVTPHLALRIQYRGLFYKVPDFNNPNLFTGSRGHLAEAAAGLVIKF